MRGLLFAAVSLISLGVASAAPAELDARQGGPPTSCMPPPTATTLAHAFASLIGAPFNRTLAVDALSPTFHDYSDSVITLIDNACSNGPIPLGTAGFTSRKDFISSQSTQKPIPFAILNIWPACNSVALRWRASPGTGTVQPEEIITGIIVLETVPSKQSESGPPSTWNGYNWQIQNTYSEFNSGAWLYDLGAFTPTNCPPS